MTIDYLTTIVERNLCRTRWRDMLLMQYTEYLRHKGSNKKTIEWHQQKLIAFREYLLTLPLLERNKPADANTIYKYLDYRRNQGKSENTVAGDYRALKAIMSWAVKNGFLTYNIFNDVRPVKPVPCNQNPFTPGEIARILAVHNGNDWVSKRNVAILMFLYDTGVRVTAMTKLQLPDIDLEKRSARVIDKYSKRRSLSWGDRTHIALIDYMNKRPKIKSEYVFINNKYNCISRTGVYQMFQKTLVKAGIPRRKLHMLRASFACQFLIAGGPERKWQLQLAMGLADDSQIKQVYASTIMDDMTMVAMRDLSPGDRLPVSTPPCIV